MINPNRRQPVSPQNIIRILVVMVVVLAFLAGYYQTKLVALTRKYATLSERYQQNLSPTQAENTQ